MGLGTRLLNYTIDFLQREYEQCVNIWLHVIAYNQSAIKFYLKNKFVQFRRLKQHYVISGKEYDAIVLYRLIGRKAREFKDE